MQHPQRRIGCQRFFGMPKACSGIHHHEMVAVDHQSACSLVVVTHDAFGHPGNDLVISMLMHRDQATGIEDGFYDHGEGAMAVIGRLRRQPARHVDVRDETSRIPHHEGSFALEQHLILHARQ
ncbi:hypothetical protein FHT79_000702 [Rhizobium sp. BK212]|nr:hypothetical protein [Rhizobium sp. BK212]